MPSSLCRFSASAGLPTVCLADRGKDGGFRFALIGGVLLKSLIRYRPCRKRTLYGNRLACSSPVRGSRARAKKSKESHEDVVVGLLVRMSPEKKATKYRRGNPARLHGKRIALQFTGAFSSELQWSMRGNLWGFKPLPAALSSTWNRLSMLLAPDKQRRQRQTGREADKVAVCPDKVTDH